jgi:hypothetical protein
VPLRQPLAHARRQQQLLIAITRKEVLRHPGIVFSTPDGAAPLRNSLRDKQHRRLQRSARKADGGLARRWSRRRSSELAPRPASVSPSRSIPASRAPGSPATSPAQHLRGQGGPTRDAPSSENGALRLPSRRRPPCRGCARTSRWVERSRRPPP